MAGPRGIVAGELRALKPLAWLLAAAFVLLGGSLLWLELRERPQPPRPAHLVIDAKEKLSADDILFTETRPSVPYAQGDFTPLVIYEVALKDPSKRFSHPFMLNFFGEREEGLALARKDKEGWLRLMGAVPGPHPEVALSVKADQPGVYAMGRFSR